MATVEHQSVNWLRAYSTRWQMPKQLTRTLEQAVRWLTLATPSVNAGWWGWLREWLWHVWQMWSGCEVKWRVLDECVVFAIDYCQLLLLLLLLRSFIQYEKVNKKPDWAIRLSPVQIKTVKHKTQKQIDKGLVNGKFRDCSWVFQTT